MKRKEVGEALIERVDYPNKGRFRLPETGEKGIVKNVIPGQKVSFRVYKKHKETVFGNRLEVLEKSPLETREPFCDQFGRCGGCLYQTLPYETQLKMKAEQVQNLLKEVLSEDSIFDGIKGSPHELGYRNKLDLSFGDEVIGGPLTLGMHKTGTRYTVLDADTCKLAHPDMTTILKEVRAYCTKEQLPFYNKLRHEGFLRYLMLRRSETTGEILVLLAVSSQMSHDFTPLAERLCALQLTGSIAGVFMAIDDRYADALIADEVHCLYGRDYFYETILGLRFKVTLFSFFQTNTAGAEVLYDMVRRYVRSHAVSGAADMKGSIGSPGETAEADGARTDAAGTERGETKTAETDRAGTDTAGADRGETENGEIRPAKPDTLPVLYDLFCGTGTIAQVLAQEAKQVYGIELIEEAVEAASKNAALNELDNCMFYAGDVFETLPAMPEKPDFVILDPPREGVHEKTLKLINGYGINGMVYISCKASSFVSDMRFLKENGWKIVRYCLVDLFPETHHVETVVLMSRKDT